MASFNKHIEDFVLILKNPRVHQLPVLECFHTHSNSHSTTDTKCSTPFLSTALPERMNKRDEDSRARSTNWMSERD